MKELNHPYIVVPHGCVAKIANHLKVSRTMVSYALNYRTNSKLSEKIRSVAIELYNGYRVNPIKS